MVCQVNRNEHFRHLLISNQGSEAVKFTRDICAVDGKWQDCRNGFRSWPRGNSTSPVSHVPIDFPSSMKISWTVSATKIRARLPENWSRRCDALKILLPVTFTVSVRCKSSVLWWHMFSTKATKSMLLHRRHFARSTQSLLCSGGFKVEGPVRTDYEGALPHGGRIVNKFFSWILPLIFTQKYECLINSQAKGVSSYAEVFFETETSIVTT